MPKVGIASCAMMSTRWITPLKMAAELGFEAYEINCAYPSVELDNTPPEVIAKAKDILSKSGMDVCVHAPFFELNIAAFSDGIRQQSIGEINKAVDLCAAVGGQVLIVHAGDHTYSELKGVSRHDNPLAKRQWDNNIDSLKRINDYAQAKGITVCLENIGFNAIDQCYADLIDIRKEVGDSLQFTLDFGHARLQEGAEKGIAVLGDNIRHIHLHDNKGASDDHLPIGFGNYDFSAFVDYFKNYPGVITLEMVQMNRDAEPIIKCKENFEKLLAG